MRVALSFHGCHRRGGVERILLECANYLQRRGHEVHIYSSAWDKAALESQIHCHDVHAYSRPPVLRALTFSRQCTLEIQKSRPPADVLGAFGVMSPPGGVLWVQSVHRAWMEISHRNRGLSGRLKQRLNPIHPVLLRMEQSYFGDRKYKKLIALTGAVKSDLMRLYHVPDEDIVILPNGYSPTEFSLERRDAYRQEMRAQLGYQERDRVVLFVANELERKGFGPLLRALSLLKNDAVRLLVVGRVSPGTYQAEIQQSGFADRIQFTGSANEVARYYAAADLFALPTQYEAWGMVIVEALACGLPVLTSRLAGAAITVQEGHTGYLLEDPRDVTEIAGKVRQLLDCRMEPPERIADSVREYAWPRILARYEQVLLECSDAAMPALN
jgi:UDP-glucose:(heptosyl)LPS alpha-1,3-glucosyltransferase